MLIAITALAIAALALWIAGAKAASPNLTPVTHMGLTAQQWQNKASHRAVLLQKAKGEVTQLKRANGWLRDRAINLKSKLENPSDPLTAIRIVFGVYADQAISVSDCETGGTFSVYAKNGQYLGLFQMGSWERRTYGHSLTPIGQAKAAYAYFVASGKDWSPWECKP